MDNTKDIKIPKWTVAPIVGVILTIIVVVLAHIDNISSQRQTLFSAYGICYVIMNEPISPLEVTMSPLETVFRKCEKIKKRIKKRQLSDLGLEMQYRENLILNYQLEENDQ